MLSMYFILQMEFSAIIHLSCIDQVGAEISASAMPECTQLWKTGHTISENCSIFLHGPETVSANSNRAVCSNLHPFLFGPPAFGQIKLIPKTHFKHLDKEREHCTSSEGKLETKG